MRECAAGSDGISPLTATLADPAQIAQVSIEILLPAAAGEGGRRPDEGPVAQTNLVCAVLEPLPRHRQECLCHTTSDDR